MIIYECSNHHVVIESNSKLMTQGRKNTEREKAISPK